MSPPRQVHLLWGCPVERILGDRRQSAKNRTGSIVLGLTVWSAALLAGTAGTQDAVANGDTRSLTFFHTHTRESATITFRRNGQYDDQGLSQLNWLLRDWRVDEPAKMDPRLFDILWEVRRELQSNDPIHVISAYRSPETNGMLRHRSRAVSEHSQHMAGKAIDIRMPDIETARLRAVAMRMQYGGVGYYPSSQFVHIDTGGVRAWPRMSLDQLARLFPDGKTLHLPPSGKPLPGYEQAKVEILARNAALAGQASAGASGSFGSLMAAMFGRGNSEDSQRSAVSVSTAKTNQVAPETIEPSISLAPLPPRRPSSPPTLFSTPAPDASAELAAVNQPNALTPQAKFSLWQDEKTVIRALFDPGTAVLDVRFSPEWKDALDPARFTGPAVQPLPILQTEADL